MNEPYLKNLTNKLFNSHDELEKQEILNQIIKINSESQYKRGIRDGFHQAILTN